MDTLTDTRHSPLMADWQAVGRAVSDRIARQGTTQAHIAKLSGVSPKTMQELCAGRSDRDFRASTLAAVSQALGWPPDALQTIADGGDPPAELSPADVVGALSQVLTQLGTVAEQQQSLARRLDALAQRLDALER